MNALFHTETMQFDSLGNAPARRGRSHACLVAHNLPAFEYGFRTTIGDFEVTETMMLKRGDQVPHFEVRTVHGGVFSYSTIWQRKNLLLVLLPKSSSDAGYISDLRAYESEFRSLDTECVIARDDVPWLRGPAVLLADRWGEVIHITAASESARSPAADDLLPWLQYLENRCPECEGEAK